VEGGVQSMLHSWHERANYTPQELDLMRDWWVCSITQVDPELCEAAIYTPIHHLTSVSRVILILVLKKRRFSADVLQ